MQSAIELADQVANKISKQDKIIWEFTGIKMDDNKDDILQGKDKNDKLGQDLSVLRESENEKSNNQINKLDLMQNLKD